MKKQTIRNTNRSLLIPYLLWMVIFITTPAVLLIYFSLLDINGHFSLTNYQQIFTTKYLKMFAYPISCAASIMIITLIISYPVAYYIIRSKFQNALLMVMIIPTWINLLLETYAFIGLLSHDGVINQFFHLSSLPSFNLLLITGAFLVAVPYAHPRAHETYT